MYFKKVALISSFCDNQEKIDVLKKNIRIVKSNNLDVIVISPFNLGTDVTELCDYFFITKDNPVFQWPERAMYAWKILESGGNKYKITTTYADYGYAGLHQVKQLSQIALNLDYDQFFHMIYDLRIDENVIDGFSSNKFNSIYPSKREETIWAVGLHYMIFDRENLINFISKITKESYLNIKGSDAFVWLHTLQSILNYKIEPIPVEDEIYYYQTHDFFNFSEIPNLKFFIEKNDETLSSIKILFYELDKKTSLDITLDEETKTHEIENLKIIDLGFNKTIKKNVLIHFENKTYDISNTIDKIRHNTLDSI